MKSPRSRRKAAPRGKSSGGLRRKTAQVTRAAKGQARRRSKRGRASDRMKGYWKTVHLIASAENVSLPAARELYRGGVRGVRAGVIRRTYANAAGDALRDIEFVPDPKTGRPRPNVLRDRSTGRFLSRATFNRRRAATRREAILRAVQEIEGGTRADALETLRDYGGPTMYMRFVLYIYDVLSTPDERLDALTDVARSGERKSPTPSPRKRAARKMERKQRRK